MAEINSGIRALLQSPAVYKAFQNLMGAQQGWTMFVEEFVQPKAGQVILDIGCGPGDLLAYLPDVEYWGFDISEVYVAYARRRYGNRGHFLCKFLTLDDLDSMPRFDVVVASGVLHHMDDDMARSFLEVSRAALKPGGRLVTVDPCWADDQHPVARFLISWDRGKNVRSAAGYEQLVLPVFAERRVTVRHKAWIPYTHCFMECERG